MQFKVDYNYRSRVEALSQKYKKLTPVFNCNGAIDIGFELGNREVLISEGTGFNEKRYVYRYRQIKKIISFTDGLLVIFKDKKFVFLPVTDNEIADEDLVFIAQVFHEQFKLKFHIKGRLYVINYDSHKQKRKRVNFDFADSPIIVTIISVVALLVGVLIATLPNIYIPVSKEECIVYTGEYESFEKDDDDTFFIYFKNGDEQWIDYSCYSSKLYSEIVALEKGTKLEILLHPDSEYVVELVCDGEEILNLNFAQEAMYEDASYTAWLGYLVIAAGTFLLIYAIIRFANERSGITGIEGEER